ncbi:MAG: AarF/ABC1/UbiB kinase family protein, partial [Rhodothermales bacterium]
MPNNTQTETPFTPTTPVEPDGATNQHDAPGEAPRSAASALPETPAPQTETETHASVQTYKPPTFILDPLAPYKGAVRRFFIAYRHVLGLLMGGVVAYARALPPERRRRLRSPGPRLLALLLKPFVKRSLVNLPFPTQLRRRLEMLGPTFIKLGQVMAIREDLLPPSVTDELKHLF